MPAAAVSRVGSGLASSKLPEGSEFELLMDLRVKLAGARRGVRGALVQQSCELLGCTQQTLYRKLKSIGFDSGRRQRTDAGERVLDDAQLRALSGALFASYNGRDQRMPIETALAMVRASALARGEAFPEVHASTASRQLYERRLHPEQLMLPTESVRLTSLHPNHVWQVDSTTGAYYYLPQGRLRWMDEAEFNKNKVANLVKASSDLLTRYSAADHTSHAFKVRYFLGGESAENLLNFLVWAMWKQPSGPMCGVPHILMTDQGPANKSRLMALFCQRLGIRHLLHAPGNARATGSVEKAHDLARMHLETRYHFNAPAEVTLDKLNSDAELWAAAYCSGRKHTRHGRTRYAAWMEINRYDGALRLPATEDALRDAASSEPVTPRVGNDKRIAFRGRQYLLATVPGVIAGLKVTVQLNVYRAPAIDVQFVCPDTGAQSWHVVEPEATNEWGFDGTRVIGAEQSSGQGFRSARASVLDDNRNALKRAAYKTGDELPTLEEAERARKAHAQAYRGTIDPLADVKATPVPAYLPRRVSPLPLPERAVQTRRLTPVEAASELKRRMGERYSPQVYAHVSAAFADGVAEDQLDAIEALFAPAQTAAASGLRVVNGGTAAPGAEA
jgi:hypothetical protein